MRRRAALLAVEAVGMTLRYDTSDECAYTSWTAFDDARMYAALRAHCSDPRLDGNDNGHQRYRQSSLPTADRC
eukprot:scaffold113879_cov37-Prasinocladus_malaysianus.AAC.1